MNDADACGNERVLPKGELNIMWRRGLQLNWRYAVGELILITAGVLVALACNQWNNRRLEHAEERAYLGRLLADLETDAASIEAGLAILADKDLQLHRIQGVLMAPTFEPQSPSAFLSDVAASSSYGWTQHRARRTTLDELVASGRFDLIRNPGLRAQISDYYDLDLQSHDRIQQRQTQYPNLTYELVPRADEYELDAKLTEGEIRQLAQDVYDSSLRDYVIAELNLTRFMKDRFDEWRKAHDALVPSVRRYVETLH